MLINLALAGFGFAALAYVVLAALLAARGAPAGPGRLLLSAVVAEALWATLIAWAISRDQVPASLVSLAEALRLFLWAAFLLSLLRAMGRSNQAGDTGRPAPATQRAANTGLAAAATISAGTVAIEVFAFGERPAFIMQVIGAVFALVCLEQVYRNTPASGRWAIKFLAIALLALFGFDLVMYSEALLFSRMNPALWTARGFANGLLVPLLAVAAARNRNWKLDITVSREVVFHTTTLFAAGAFLLLMALGGYYVRYFGGEWGEAAQVLLLFSAAIGVLLGAMSGSARARLRVFLAKHFFRYRYDYRAEWLKLTQLLAVPPGSDTDQHPLETRALQGLSGLVESHGGALWMASDDRGYTCAARISFGADTPTLSADEPLIRFLRETRWVVSLPEWREQPDLYHGLALPPSLAAGDDIWLIVPLMLHDELLGFAVLTRPVATATVDWEVRDALKAAARQVASYLGVRRAVESLVQARQFESFNRMSAFVVHDLKNLVAQLSLLLANAARHRDNPEFQQDMLDTVGNVQARMQALLMQLRAGTRPIEPAGAVPLAETLEAAVRGKRAMRPEPVLSIAPELRHAAVLAHRDRLERVIGHLVQNAAEATPKDGTIAVRLTRQGDMAQIEVEDTGKGMSEQFIRERLFKPFSSTKDHGMGIGAFESREYIRELGGTLEVESREHAGTTFRIRLPLAKATATA